MNSKPRKIIPILPPFGVYDFHKFTSIIGYSDERLRQCHESIERMATAEDLPGYVHSLAARFQPQEKDENPS